MMNTQGCIFAFVHIICFKVQDLNTQNQCVNISCHITKALPLLQTQGGDRKEEIGNRVTSLASCCLTGTACRLPGLYDYTKNWPLVSLCSIRLLRGEDAICTKQTVVSLRGTLRKPPCLSGIARLRLTVGLHLESS